MQRLPLESFLVHGYDGLDLGVGRLFLLAVDRLVEVVQVEADRITVEGATLRLVLEMLPAMTRKRAAATDSHVPKRDTCVLISLASRGACNRIDLGLRIFEKDVK